jgi:L-cysteine S-thiosulfotransferase
VRFKLALSTALAGLCAFFCLAAAEGIPDSVVERYLKGMFQNAVPNWQERLVQDETQRICSEYRNDPPQAEAAKIVAREKAVIIIPADGVLSGDWKRGELIAQTGQGGQFGETADTVSGGNCYACHRLAPSETAYGTLGPSLFNYGKDRGFSPEAAKAAYAKIYDAQAVTPCSLMPRFGRNGFLTEQQIEDVLAYLFDPGSPVNGAMGR